MWNCQAMVPQRHLIMLLLQVLLLALPKLAMRYSSMLAV